MASGHADFVDVIIAGEIAGKNWIPNQIANLLRQVTPGIQTKMKCRGVIEPLDTTVHVKHDYAGWRSLKGGQEVLQTLIDLTPGPVARTRHAAHAIRDFAPQPSL